MKRHLISAIAALMLVGLGAPSAQASVYTWSKYDLTFVTPDGGFVTYSSSTRFEEQWDDMALVIKLYSKSRSDEKTINNNLTRKALDYSMYDNKLGKMKVKGFKTLYVEGTMPDGSRAVIADLVSDKQDLIIEVTINYLFGDRETVDDIITSFAEGKKPEEAKEQKHKQKVQTKKDAEKQEKNRSKEQERRKTFSNKQVFDA
ncbi:MAG: hypothetical protein MJZ74_02735 [Muribaculaceae bacterium]|nr:hypothetical protein [Muribaculaceae bacterium]